MRHLRTDRRLNGWGREPPQASSVIRTGPSVPQLRTAKVLHAADRIRPGGVACAPRAQGIGHRDAAAKKVANRLGGTRLQRRRRRAGSRRRGRMRHAVRDDREGSRAADEALHLAIARRRGTATSSTSRSGSGRSSVSASRPSRTASRSAKGPRCTASSSRRSSSDATEIARTTLPGLRGRCASCSAPAKDTSDDLCLRAARRLASGRGQRADRHVVEHDAVRGALTRFAP